MFEWVLSYSKWTYVTLAVSETFEALVAGLQRALWTLGAVPDSRSSGPNNDGRWFSEDARCAFDAIRRRARDSPRVSPDGRSGRGPRPLRRSSTAVRRTAGAAAGHSSLGGCSCQVCSDARRVRSTTHVWRQVLLPLNVNYSCRFGRLLVQRRTVRWALLRVLKTQKTKRRERPLGDVHGVR